MRDKIGRAKEGIRGEVLKCMDANKGDMTASVREQLYSGIDGDDNHLSPSYLSDPYFRENPRAGFFDEEAGHYVNCFMHPERYLAWKRRITPPIPGERLGLPPRPDDVPNLFIIGTFHGSISARATSGGVEIFTHGWQEGPAVEAKYGSQIFGLSTPAVGRFNEDILMPWLRRWMEGV